MSEKIETGGPAFPCAKCEEQAVIKQGRQWLCAKHYRFGQMRSLAKRRGKDVPSHEDLHSMPGADLACPDCGVRMNWRSKDGQSTVASLQHYRDGTMAIVCRSCNTRHAFMLGDEYRHMPAGQKMCPSCRQIKLSSEFTADNGRSGQLRRKSYCKSCADKSVTKWKEENRDKYNEYQRQYRSRRKAEGNPIRSGT